MHQTCKMIDRIMMVVEAFIEQQYVRVFKNGLTDPLPWKVYIISDFFERDAHRSICGNEQCMLHTFLALGGPFLNTLTSCCSKCFHYHHHIIFLQVWHVIFYYYLLSLTTIFYHIFVTLMWKWAFSISVSPYIAKDRKKLSTWEAQRGCQGANLDALWEKVTYVAYKFC